MSQEIKDFSSLFQITPNISILDLNNSCSNITQYLSDFVSPFNGEITTINSTIDTNFKSKIKRSNYDYGVICNTILNSNDQNTLMKIITMAIRDSGYIVILEKKDKNIDIIYQLLEEFDYGAVSSIDIFEKYSLIMGKKLHMWGMD